MYCPRCAQQQVSDDMKFCSRCGLSLAGLSNWVASGGGLYVPGAPLALPKPRRKGVRRGAKVVFASAVMFPIFLALSFLVDEPVPLLLPFIALIVGLSTMIYSRIFEELPITSHEVQQSRLGTTVGNTALPPAPSIPVSNVNAQNVRTSELAQPASVTEHTTKLLDKD